MSKDIKTADERFKEWEAVTSSLVVTACCSAQFRMYLSEEISELRAAYEALQAENAAQAKRIEELEQATEHLGLTSQKAADGLARYKAQVKYIAELEKDNQDLTKMCRINDDAIRDYITEIKSLRKIKQAVENLVNCKGRYHTEQNMIALQNVLAALKNGDSK